MIGESISGEIKTPYSNKKYLEYLAIKNGKDLRKFSKNYYYQMQMQIECVGADCGILAAFNPKFLQDRKDICLHIVEVQKDVLVIDEIKSAISDAVSFIKELQEVYGL